MPISLEGDELDMSDVLKDPPVPDPVVEKGAGDQGDGGSPPAGTPRVTDSAGLVPLAPGRRVQGIITGITDYGAFLVTDEGRRGLIHISEITDWYVERAEDYFYRGERVEAEVIHFDEQSGKYAFSTRRVGGKQPLPHRYADRLLALHRQGLGNAGRGGRRGLGRSRDRRPRDQGRRRLGSGLTPFPPSPASAEGRPEAVGSAGKEAVSAAVEGLQGAADLLQFLRRHVGQVSPAARAELERLVQSYGAARVALALAQVIEGTDRSLQVVQAAGERLAGG